VPLSEHEQRILAELEESLSQQDPTFADRVANETVYRHAGRQCKWAAFTFVLGLIELIALYSVSVILGLLGVAIMFASAVVFERNLRKMGRASWHDITRSLHEEERSGAEGGIETAVHDARDWFRSRFHRRED
jgi:Flp pilus assembly protein TadB